MINLDDLPGLSDIALDKNNYDGGCMVSFILYFDGLDTEGQSALYKLVKNYRGQIKDWYDRKDVELNLSSGENS